jgi:hypothetical protein
MKIYSYELSYLNPNTKVIIPIKGLKKLQLNIKFDPALASIIQIIILS